MNPTSIPPAAELVADAIARIEARRVALDRLADKGMEMVERLAAGETVEIAKRKSFADPVRAFAVVSRAVRLCLALASRLDEELIALLRGGPIPDLAILAPEASPASKAPAPIPAPVAAPEAPAAVSDPRARVARAMDAAIEAEAGDREDAERLRAYVQEHLIEGEDYDALLDRPWRVVVQAICSDLGLRPDWSGWDNGEGFKVRTDDPELVICDPHVVGPTQEHLSQREREGPAPAEAWKGEGLRSRKQGPGRSIRHQPEGP